MKKMKNGRFRLQCRPNTVLIIYLKPENNNIYFQEIEPSLAAVIRFNGKADEKLLNLKTDILMRWIESKSYVKLSRPKFLFYNDPTTPGFLRRNEVMILVEK
jgi:DNA gyrase inhibitor GyrI